MTTKADLLDNLDDFTTAYIECALWSSAEISEDGDMGETLDANYSAENLTVAALKDMISDCRDFQDSNAADIEGLDSAQCGHDFWLTRNGHGAGFWDRGLGELGDRLSAASKVYGGVDLMVHRGRIYS